MKLVTFTQAKLFLLVIFMCLISSVHGQITVNGMSPYSDYVYGLEGPGVQISNVNIDCDTILPQMGGFDGTNAGIGLDSGLIITSGDIDNALPGGNIGAAVGSPGDPLLDAFGFGFTNDACAITFDFVPACDTIRIRYVFASNEYPTFVGLFNDAFGCFISGPGFAPNTNIALVPVTNQPISVATVNPGQNTTYYINNQNGAAGTEYNGMTVVMEAVAAVQFCQTYTIRLSVADEGDFAYDTGVFIEAIQCGEDPPSVTAGNFNNANSPTAVEDCVDGFFTFTNPGDTTVATPVNFALSGTATNGVDYTFPGTVTIPAGQSSITVPVNIISDGLIEGPETIKCVIDFMNCLSFSDSAILTIYDPFETAAGPDQALCSGELGTLGLAPQPGVIYDWTPEFGLQPPYNIANPNVFLNTQTSLFFNYILNATDTVNGCAATDTVLIEYIPLPEISFGMDASVCVDGQTTIVFTEIQDPDYVYFWDFAGASSVTGSGPGPYVVSWNTPGIKTVGLYVLDGDCSSDTISQDILVHPIPTSSFLVTSPVCAGNAALVTYTGSAGPGATYTWDFDGGSGGSGPGPFGVTWTIPGTKEVTLTVIENGCVSDETVHTVVVNQVPTATFSLPSVVCIEDQVQIVYTGNGTSSAGYAWNFDGGQVISGNGQGPYVVEWLTGGTKTVCLQVEENGCISTLECLTINVLESPHADIDPEADQCLDGNSFDFTYSGDPGVTTYIWNFGADASPASSTSATPPTVQYLNPGIKTITLIVSLNGCVSDTALIEVEVIEDPEADFSASTMAICQHDCITFNYTGTSPGPQTTYQWNFGPGSVPVSSTQPNPPCIEYGSGGNKQVSLLVNYRGCVDAISQTITVHPGPTVNAGPDVEFCDGEGGAPIEASVSGGTMPYFYTWTCADPPNCGLSSSFIEDPIANPVVNPYAPDTMVYYFQVYDVNGCASNIDSVEVHVKAKPRMDAGEDVFICADGPGAFLNGGPAPLNQAPLPIDYMWIPAEGLNDPTLPNPYARPDTTTIYTLVGSSINGCTSDVNTLDTLSTVTVHVKPLPIADAGPDTAICLLESVQLQGHASGSGPDYTYQWTPALPGVIDDPTSPSPTVTPGFTTTFYLVVNSNECASKADSVTVTVDTRPTVSPGSDESICLFDSVQIDGSASGDPFGTQYSYEWSPTNGLNDPFSAKPNASPNTTTTYTVIAYSEHGCGSDAASITVTIEPTPIVLALNNDTIICEGDTIELRAIHDFKTPPGNPVVYEWTPQDGSILSSPYVPDIQIAPTTTTLYTVEVSVSGDCPTTDEVLVTVSPEIIVGLTADTTRICQEDATQLHATGGLGNATFSWVPEAGLDDPSSDEPWASPDETTTYTVIVAEGACVDSASITLDINPRPIVDYFASQIRGCAGLEVSFLENTQFANNFLWDFGDGSPVNNELNPSHVYNEPGTYTVSLTAVGQGGCEATTSKVSIQVDPAAMANFQADPDFGSDLALPNASVLFTDLSEQAVSWRWNFGDGNSSTEVNPSHTYSEPGIYEVSLTVTDANGCSNTVTYGSFTVLSADLMIPNFFSPNGDGVNDIFRISYSGSDSYQLDIFDRWGRSVFSSNAPQDGWEGQDMNGGTALEGVYFYAMRIGEKNFQGEITLMR